MAKHPHGELGRRERQLLEILLRLDRASVAEVRDALPDPPSYSAVRTMLGVLEDKGYVAHTQEGRRYVYQPATPPQKTSRHALLHLVRTFFGGSRERAMIALLDLDGEPLSDSELNRLSRLLDEHEKEATGEGTSKGEGRGEAPE